MQAAFYKGRTRLFNRLVSWWLDGKYSHCEIVIGTNQHGISTCASSSFLDGGVRVKLMALNPDHWDVINVGGSAETAIAWLAAHEEQGYDYLGVAGFIARALGQDKQRWFCSEAVAEMLGMPDSWRFDPCSLWAALSRPVASTNQPATAGFFTPTET